MKKASAAVRSADGIAFNLFGRRVEVSRYVVLGRKKIGQLCEREL